MLVNSTLKKMKPLNLAFCITSFKWRLRRQLFCFSGLRIGKSSVVDRCNLLGLRCIEIGDRSTIGPYSTITALQSNAKIMIGNDCLLTHSVQIYSALSVTVEDHCMIAGGVFIADTTHSTARGDIPYSQQGLTKPRSVIIHEGAWVGQNTIIMPGCNIGKCSVIGANSVVTESIPANVIAVGAPARVIKRFSSDHHIWKIA